MFKIVNSSPAILDHQTHKEISKPSARQILKSRCAQEEIKSTDPWYRKRIDPVESAKNARLYKRDYERTLPEKLNPSAENEMWKRAKLLKDDITLGMLSREELHPVKGFLVDGSVKYVVDEERMRTNNSVDREVAWQRRNDVKIKEFKNIMRHLNPDDPNAGDIEKYRPKLRGKN